MSKLLALCVGLMLALALLTPLAAVIMSAQPTAAPVMRVADEPTPTPTPFWVGGNAGCHGHGC